MEDKFSFAPRPAFITKLDEALPDAAPAGQSEGPADPNFRWNGQRTDGDKSPEAAARARQNMFATLADFAAWRKGKGMPTLSPDELEAAFARYRGAPVIENAMLIPERETRVVVGAGSAGVHVGRKF